MFTPLSRRLNPECVALSYPNVTDRLKNQINSVIIDFISSLNRIPYSKTSSRFACDYDFELCSSIGVDVFEYRGSSALYNVKKHLKDLDGEHYLDALDIFVQMVYSNVPPEGCEDVSMLFEDLNEILRNNGVDLKIEGGLCVRVMEPMIQKEVICPAF